MNTKYDVIIVGGGIAGLTAAIYTARANLKTLVLESDVLGGQIVNATNIENYPGYVSISGVSLINNIKHQLDNLNVEIKYERVIGIDEFNVKTEDNIYNAKGIIIASGLKKKSLPIFDKYIGSGVSFCATCDGNFYRGKDVAIVGGGNTALEDALYLSNIASKVYLIHRRNEFRGEDYLVNKIKDTSNIELVLNHTIKDITGEGSLDSIILDDDTVLNVSGLFVAIGSTCDTTYLSNVVNLDNDGYIVSSKYNNIFIAGDALSSNKKQLIIAAGSGAEAAISLIDYIRVH